MELSVEWRDLFGVTIEYQRFLLVALRKRFKPLFCLEYALPGTPLEIEVFKELERLSPEEVTWVLANWYAAQQEAQERHYQEVAGEG